MVGVTSCLTLLLSALESAVHLPPDAARITNVYARPQGWRGKSGQEASGWTLQAVKENATSRATLERVTRCDNTLYADALGRLPPASLSYANATCSSGNPASEQHVQRNCHSASHQRRSLFPTTRVLQRDRRERRVRAARAHRYYDTSCAFPLT